MQRFGDKIRTTRQAAGLTQTEVADTIGVGQKFISQIEAHERYPSPSLAQSLCKALGLGRPWPAYCFQQSLAASDARARGISFEDAYRDLVTETEEAFRQFALQKQ